MNDVRPESLKRITKQELANEFIKIAEKELK